MILIRPSGFPPDPRKRAIVEYDAAEAAGGGGPSRREIEAGPGPEIDRVTSAPHQKLIWVERRERSSPSQEAKKRRELSSKAGKFARTVDENSALMSFASGGTREAGSGSEYVHCFHSIYQGVTDIDANSPTISRNVPR